MDKAILNTEDLLAEIERLRAIEAAALALGPGAPQSQDRITYVWRCYYCDRWGTHAADCKWTAFQTALHQNQGQSADAGERGGGSTPQEQYDQATYALGRAIREIAADGRVDLTDERLAPLFQAVDEAEKRLGS